jgi:hypothetical protein
MGDLRRRGDGMTPARTQHTRAVLESLADAPRCWLELDEAAGIAVLIVNGRPSGDWCWLDGAEGVASDG